MIAAFVLGGANLSAQNMQPVVAIHDSELTRALQTQPATGATPVGAGTTGFQWWPTDWRYFVMPESVKEALRSDGTPYTVIGDSNITAGLLLPNGLPRYPIVISLASEAIANSQIAQLTNYVAAGGYLVVGSSAFTRNPDGTSRGDFAIANEMGLHQVSPTLANWTTNGTLTKVGNHRLLSHLPNGQLTWRLPAAAEEISWGTSPSYNTPTFVYEGSHDVWRVQAADATVIAQGDAAPYITVKKFGKGYFIYIAAFQPLIGHGGNAPSMYAYVIFRQAIEWAFEAAKLPVAKLSVWPFEYDAAFIVRHDLENFAASIANIEASAQVEAAFGAKGDYYFCTGTLREDMSPAYDTNAVITSLQRAAVLYGATIAPHNGGLRNPRNPGLVELDYDFWHWGPDEALDVTPLGYIDGKSYAMESLEISFQDIERWLPFPMSSATRLWCAPRFNATREDSLDAQARVGVKITGDQKLTPFPHWTLSTRTPGLRYPLLSQPVSDWFVGGAIAQSLEPWRPPSIHSSATMRAGVDFYYALGGLVNFYSHTMATGLGDAGQLMPEFIAYCANTNIHPRMWSANALSVYDWWVRRSTAQVGVSSSTNGNQVVTTMTISGASDPRTTVELLVPATGAISTPQILLNGVAAAAGSYRIDGRLIKIRVGTTTTNVQVSYRLAPIAANDTYQTVQNTPLTVTAPGVLSNDQSGDSAAGLTAVLVAAPAHGSLTLSANGGFVYTPASGYFGSDLFTYQASNGVTNSATATVNISITRPGEFFADDFNRSVEPNQIAPWSVASGTWTITNGVLTGVSSLNSYGSAYLSANNWSNYTVSARIQFASINALGGGIGGRLNAATGARYAAWVYPEGSVGGSSMLKLIKFTGWSSWSGTPVAIASLPSVGTVAHTLALTFNGSTISVSYDGAPVVSIVDTGFESVAPYTAGGITADIYTYDAPYLLSVDDVTVTALVQLPIVQNDSYQMTQGTVLNVPASGVLANDQNGSGIALTATLVTSPARGTLSWSGNGAFTYTPTNNFAGFDSFTYQARSGSTNFGTGTVSIYVARPGELFFDDFNRNTAGGGISPWSLQAGNWIVTNGVLVGSSPANTYGNVFVHDNSWSSYTVQARFQFSSSNALGAGLGGRLNPVTGAHYAAWIYPEGSFGGSSVLKLIKFTGWQNWSGVPMQTVALPGVGTNWHTLALTFQDASIAGFYDGVQVLNFRDDNYEGIAPYATGGVSLDVYTFDVPYTFSVDDFSVISLVTNQPPVITSSPASTTNLVGAAVTFSVTASGSGLSYQWRRNGTNISGANGSTFTIPSVTGSDAGNYTVEVSNSAGSAISGVAVLTVTLPPTFVWSAPVAITTADATLNLAGNIVGAEVFGTTAKLVTLSNGTSILFTADRSVATATGAGGATLPMYNGFFAQSTTGNADFNAVLTQGAYDNGPHTITLKGLTVGQQYSVQLFALDDRGGVIGERVSNYQDPLNSSNASATFAMSNKVYIVGTFTANNTNVMIQQNLPTSSNGAVNAGNINALVVRAIGGVYPPVIVAQPASRTNIAGTAASFSVVATGSSLRYQWQLNGTNIAAATNSTYAVSNAQPANAGNYSVSITGATGSANSAIATLTVIVPPVIVSQPTSRTNLVRTATTFTVAASGTELSYQWRFNGTNIAGATSNSYTLASVQTTNAGAYSVVVSNLAGAVTSVNAQLTVAPVFVWSTPVAITTADATLNLTGNIVGAAVFGNTNTLVTLANGTSLLFQSGGAIASATGPTGETLPIYSGSFFANSTTGNASFNSVLGQGVYDNGPHIITLKGLTVGQQYSVQLFALDDRGTVVGARLSNYQDPLNANNVSANFTMGSKVYVVGTFTATSTNMVIQQNLPTTNNGVANAGNLNALVVRAIGGVYPPTIVTQPTSRTNVAGTVASFSVVATGNSLRYQWQFNGANIANATNSSYSIASAQVANAGNYSVLITSSTASTTSAVATLSVVVPPTIATQPPSRSAAAGTATTFTVVANGTTLNYQWRFNGTNIVGATNSSYTIPSVQSSNGGSYTVVVSNGAGTVTSATAVLSVIVPVAPVIGTQPVSQTVIAGSAATFSVGITAGTAPVSYQWRFNGNNIVGATNSTYTVANVQTNLAGGYSVLVSNSVGNLVSSVATLAVRYSLTVTKSGSGTVSVSPAGTSFTPGTTVTLVATPSAFYRFTGWTGDVTSTASTITVNMTTNRTIRANFVFSLF